MASGTSGGRVKAARALLSGLAAVAVGGMLPFMNCGVIVDNFHRQRAERKILDAWKRQAVPVSCSECRKAPALCKDKIVVWAVANLARGQSHCEGGPAVALIWKNWPQVPVTTPRIGPMKAIAAVTDVRDAGIELVFIGTPDAPFGGTTTAKESAGEPVPKSEETF